MADRFFAPAEVEALIPALTEIMEDVMAAQAEAATVRQRLRDEQDRIAASGGGVIDRDAWTRGTAALERLGTRLQARLDDITRLGGSPKDLGLGLVDFPHLRAGHVVNLCWKYGERSIGYWHGLDEGFAARKPL